MVESVRDLRRGRIVWAAVRDRNGFKKFRPIIILTATADIAPGQPLTAMAITTSFPDPLPPRHLSLPWNSTGRTVTKLRKRSAAVLDWIVELMPDDVQQLHGDVPTALMKQILRELGIE